MASVQGHRAKESYEKLVVTALWAFVPARTRVAYAPFYFL
jgi:hypothetical protein